MTSEGGKRKLSQAPPNTPTGAATGLCGPNKRRSGVSSHSDLPAVQDSVPLGALSSQATLQHSASPICKPTPQSSGSTPAVNTAPFSTQSTPPTHAMTPSRRGRSSGLPPHHPGSGGEAMLDQARTPSSTYKPVTRSAWLTPSQSQSGVLAVASKRVVDFQLAAATSCKLSLPVEDDGLVHAALTLNGVSPIRAPTPRTPKVSSLGWYQGHP